MQSDAHKSHFISYPTDRVVGTIAEADRARDAIEALADAGFQPGQIDVLHGEEDLRRLDPTGVEHGLLARFQRTLIRTAGTAEEFKHLKHHVDDVRAGRFVIMVLAKEHRKRDAAVEILNTHGAEFVGFYGRWAYQSLGDKKAAVPHAASPAAPSYEATIDGDVTTVGLESDVTASVTHAGRDERYQATVVSIRPGIYLLSWQDANRTTVIRVDDVEAGTSHEVKVDAAGNSRHAAGTVHRVS
jgi:hypothetical protein